MADDMPTNGLATEEDNEAVIFDSAGKSDGEAKLKQKIESLERQNDEFRAQISNLQGELDSLKAEESEMMYRLEEMENELEHSEETKRTLDSIAARAGELETDVSRLQHDLITSMSQGDEYSTEIEELRRVLGDMEVKLEEAKKEKADYEKRVRELERKVGVLEVKEIEEKSKKIRLEEENREKISEKDKELAKYRKNVEDLEKELAMKAEKEERLIVSENRTKDLESKMMEMQKQAEEAEKVIVGMKQRAVDTINGFDSEDSEDKEFIVHWPVVVAGSTGAVAAAAAVAYLICARRQ
ncbi:Peroxisomal and mitochondrial division factor 1 [Linum perenne]